MTSWTRLLPCPFALKGRRKGDASGWSRVLVAREIRQHRRRRSLWVSESVRSGSSEEGEKVEVDGDPEDWINLQTQSAAGRTGQLKALV